MNSKIKVILLVSILVGSVQFFREYSTYSLDVDQTMVLRSISNDTLFGIPKHGNISSLHISNPPMHAYLYIFSYHFFKKDPALGVLLSAAILSIFTSCILGIFVKISCGFLWSIIAILVYNFLGKGPYFATSSWAQGILPNLYVIIVAFLCFFQIYRKSYYWAVSFLVASFGMGLHLSGSLIFVFLVIYTVVSVDRIKFSWMLFTVSVASILWFPYIYSILENGLKGFDGILIYSDSDVSLYYRLKHILKTLVLKIIDFPSLAWHQWMNSFVSGSHAFIGYVFVTLFVFLILSRAYSDIKALKCVFAKKGVKSLLRYKNSILSFRELRIEVLLFYTILFLFGFQSITSFDSVSRPDIAWSGFGVQVMFLIVYLSKLLKKTVPYIRKSVWFVFCLVTIVVLFEGLHGVDLSFYRYDPRKELARAISEHVNYNETRLRVAYYASESYLSNSSWLAEMHRHEAQYHVGADIDYYIEMVYNVCLEDVAADGWKEEPDFIVSLDNGKEVSSQNIMNEYVEVYENDYALLLKKK